MSEPTYRISTYDPTDTMETDGEWTLRVAGLSLWQLRAAIRQARGEGYDDNCSILVERDSAPEPRKD